MDLKQKPQHFSHTGNVSRRVHCFVRDLPLLATISVQQKTVESGGNRCQSRSHSRLQGSVALLDAQRESLTSRDISYRRDIHRRYPSCETERTSVKTLLGLKANEGGLPTDFESLRKRYEEIKEKSIAGEEGPPASRRDVEVLTTWLDFMLAQIANGDLEDIDQVYERAQLVYESCFREILRQITVHCVERGLLLQRVWTAYQGLSDRYIRQSNATRQQLLSDHKETITALKAKQVARENDLQREIYEQEEMVEDLRRQVQTLRTELDKQTFTCNNQIAQLVQCKSSLMKSKRKLYFLREDCRILAIRLKNRETHAESDIEAMKRIAMVRYKRKSSKMLENCKCYSVVAEDPEVKHLSHNELPVEKEAMAYEEQIEKLMRQPDFYDRETSISGLVDIENQETQTYIRSFAVSECQSEPTVLSLFTEPLVATIPGMVKIAVIVHEKQVKENVKVLIETAEVAIQASDVGVTFDSGTKAEDFAEQIEMFQVDLHKILGPTLTSDQLDAIEESFYSRLSFAIYSRFSEYSANRPSSDPPRTDFYPQTTPFSFNPMDSEPRKTSETNTGEEFPQIDSALRKGRSRADNGVIEENNKLKGKRRLRTRFFTVFGVKRERKQRERVVTTTPGMALVTRFLSENRKPRRIMPKKSLSRLISWVYTEKIAQRREKEPHATDNLPTFLFDLFMHKYGFEKLSEKKVNEVIGSCLYYKSDVKVGTFGRFLGLFEPFDVQELQWFLRALEGVSKWQVVIEQESEDSLFIPLSKAFDCGKSIFPHFKPQTLQDFRTHLDSLRIPDPKGLVKSGLIDLDLFLREILALGKIEEKKQSAFLQLLFSAANMNGDENLQFSEYRVLQRYLSSMEKQQAERVFHVFADIPESEGLEVAISFSAFVLLNLQWKVFTEEDLTRFDPSFPPSSEAVNQLKKDAEKVEKEIRWRLGDRNNEDTDMALKVVKYGLETDTDVDVSWLALKLLIAQSKDALFERVFARFVPTACGIFENVGRTIW